MSQPSTDRQPLLSSVHSQSSRLSTNRISFPSSSTSAFATDHSSAESASTRTGGSTLVGPLPTKQSEGRVGRKEGLPKLSRECLWSEIKCYGSYILPVLLIFGVLVVGASLIGVGIKKGWFS